MVECRTARLCHSEYLIFVLDDMKGINITYYRLYIMENPAAHTRGAIFRFPRQGNQQVWVAQCNALRKCAKQQLTTSNPLFEICSI